MKHIDYVGSNVDFAEEVKINKIMYFILSRAWESKYRFVHLFIHFLLLIRGQFAGAAA